ncbi:MAG TPA: hypothetical protein PLU71_01660 [Candidatus Dependentiae bacterium]|nr:hypothetical protein [Candidatus Dependentiae bacterium]HRQ62538.1 hypothetical protein [Candidatus Dependentiae bacterium]
MIRIRAIVTIVLITHMCYVHAGFDTINQQEFPDTIIFMFKDDMSSPEQVTIHYGLRQCTINKGTLKKILVNKDASDTGKIYIDTGYEWPHYIVEYPTNPGHNVENTYITHTIIINDLARYASGKKLSPPGFKIYEYKYQRD